MSLSLMSISARGLKNNVKCKVLFLFAKNYKGNFCFFQECHSTSDVSNLWRSQQGNDVWLAHGSEHSVGGGIFKCSFNGNVLETNSDSSGHCLVLIIAINNFKIIIINIYGYNSPMDNNTLFGRNWELLKCELGVFFRRVGGVLVREIRAEEDIIVQLSSLSQ